MSEAATDAEGDALGEELAAAAADANEDGSAEVVPNCVSDKPTRDGAGDALERSLELLGDWLPDTARVRVAPPVRDSVRNLVVAAAEADISASRLARRITVSSP